MNDRAALATLRLIRSENVGPVTFRKLLERYRSAQAALDALPDLARAGGLKREIRLCPQADAEKEFAAAEKAGASPVILGSAHYPAPLAALNDAPPFLWTKGHTHLLEKPMVAIVGARNASAAGLRIAAQIAEGLGEANLVVASGLARGVDGAAHRAALAKGTAAIVAGGVDHIYPPENEGLYHDIAREGVLVSEMMMGTRPQGRHFPRRNRIISGLSYGVLVIEAATKSGSLVTARYAADQGRDVFAVPGSPLDPRCHGSNFLLKTGAILVERADDVVEAIKPLLERQLAEPDPSQPYLPFAEPPAEEDLRSARSLVLDLLGPTPMEIDHIIRMSELTPQIVLTILLELELAGRLERHSGQRISLLAS